MCVCCDDKNYVKMGIQIVAALSRLCCCLLPFSLSLFVIKDSTICFALRSLSRRELVGRVGEKVSAFNLSERRRKRLLRREKNFSLACTEARSCLASSSSEFNFKFFETRLGTGIFPLNQFLRFVGFL